MTRRSTGPDKDTRKAVYERAGGCCQRCGTADNILQIHHRLPRQAGGRQPDNPIINCLDNLRLVCDPCHTYIESNRAESYLTGWLVHSWDDPRVVPVLSWTPTEAAW